MTEASGDLCDLSAVAQRTLLAAKEVSARELLAAHLARIDAVNECVNAVVALDADVASATAAAIDQTTAAGGDPGPLGGLVTAHKDLAETADFVTSYGSPLHAGNRPSVDSLLVSRVKAAGAVALGKTNTPEFGVGSHSFNPVYGVTTNPYDVDRSAGGSSGGAAAALRSGMVAIADGSDAGGSLRNPAAWNNVVGFRTSPRVVPRVAPGNAWSTLSIDGPMARNVADLILQLRVLAQPDERDPLSYRLDLPDVIAPAERLRVAWSPTMGGLPIEPDVAEVLSAIPAVVEALGWELVEDSLDMTEVDECFKTVRAFLFAGGPASQYSEAELARTKATYRYEVERGRSLTVDEVARAHVTANRLWQRAHAFFDHYDLLLGPVTQVSPFPVGEEYPTHVAGTAMSSYIDWMLSNCRISAFMLPALSLPAGFTAAGLPVGVQLVGRPRGDIGVLRAALALEEATNHGARAPDLDALAKGPRAAGRGPGAV